MAATCESNSDIVGGGDCGICNHNLAAQHMQVCVHVVGH